MERIPQRDKPREGTSKSTAKAGQRPWEISQYIYPEEPEDAKRSSHDDPRLESHGQHPDSDFIPSDEDGDHEALHPAFGIRATPDLAASDPSAGDQGTLAGGRRDIVDTLSRKHRKEVLARRKEVKKLREHAKGYKLEPWVDE